MTSELWTSLEQINASNIRKWLYGSVLVRDWDPAGSTTLENFTPFYTDGNLITTLLSSDNPGGPWLDLGALDENGVDFTPKYKTTPTNIWQSRFPERDDVDSDGEEVMVNCAETNPVVDSLYNNLPLGTVPAENTTLQSLGSASYSLTYSVVPQIIYRQLLILGVDAELGDALYVSEIRPKVSVIKLDKRQMNAKRADFFGLTFDCYPDPASGFVKRHLYNGPAWWALGGSIVWASLSTNVSPTAPTATAISGDKATIVFPTPTSANGPFTYTVTQDDTTSTTTGPATLVGSPSVGGGNTTVTVGSLTTADAYTFVVNATASNNSTASSAVSNSITATA